MEYRGLAWSIVASRSVLEGRGVYWIIREHHGKSRVSKCIAENDGLPTIRCSVPTRRQTYKHTGIYQSMYQATAQNIMASRSAVEGHCILQYSTISRNIAEYCRILGIMLSWGGVVYATRLPQTIGKDRGIRWNTARP